MMNKYFTRFMKISKICFHVPGKFFYHNYQKRKKIKETKEKEKLEAADEILKKCFLLLFLRKSELVLVPWKTELERQFQISPITINITVRQMLLGKTITRLVLCPIVSQFEHSTSINEKKGIKKYMFISI